MPDAALNNPFNDLFEGDPAEPAQLAMHGLLCVYHEIQAGVRGSRADEILSHLPEAPWVWQFLALPRRRLMIGLAAAAILVAMLTRWPISPEPMAFGNIARNFALASPNPFPMRLLLSDDPEYTQVSATIDKLRLERDEQLKLDEDAWLPWTQLYRNLFAVGRWDEALDEMHAFSEYAEERNRAPEGYSMYYSALYDVGKAYTAMGEYAQAMRYHLQALDERITYQTRFLAARGVTETRSREYALAMSNTLAPQYWALAAAGEATGDLPAADGYLAQAEHVLLAYLRTVPSSEPPSEPKAPAPRPSPSPFKGGGRGEGTAPYPNAIVLELHTRAIALLYATDDRTIDSQLIKVREHFLSRARWLRLSDRPGEALELLELAWQIRPYDRFKYAGESRLEFYEPFEEAYVYLLIEDYSSAINATQRAEACTSGIAHPGYPALPPIGIIARAELQFLKGVVLAGLNRADPEAVLLIDSALATIDDATTPLPPTERHRFGKLFEEWRSVRDRLR